MNCVQSSINLIYVGTVSLNRPQTWLDDPCMLASYSVSLQDMLLYGCWVFIFLRKQFQLNVLPISNSGEKVILQSLKDLFEVFISLVIHFVFSYLW